MFKKMQDDDPEKIPDELKFTKRADIDGEDMLLFAAFRNEELLGTLEMPYSLYQTCVLSGEPIWDVPVTECAAIDQQWIMERLGEEKETEE